MKKLITLAIVLVLSGCSTIANYGGSKVGKLAIEYCEFTPEARAAFRSIVNAESFPHTILITCKGTL